MKYRAEIDGLRTVAVIPVILFHAGFQLFSGGFVGVDVFFVISGYLITTIIINELERGSFRLVHFYERRARRILPALFFVMLACAPFAWFLLLPGEMRDFSQSLLAVATFSSNILFWLESGYFDRAAELKPLLHTWSLAVEEQYYIFFPLFLIAAWRFGRQWILVLLSVVFIVSLGLAQWGAYASPDAAFFLLPTRGWELLVGVFAAFYLQKNSPPQIKLLNETGSALGLVMILFAVFTFNDATPFPGFYALFPTLGAALIIFCAVKDTWVQRLLSQRGMVAIGLISYSAYLWHQPLLVFARLVTAENPSLFLIISMCLLAFVLATLSYQYVEKPFRNKNFLSTRRIFISSAVMMSAFLLVGTSLMRADADLQRYATKGFTGDIGHDTFHDYVEGNNFSCRPENIYAEAETWAGFVRCQQSLESPPSIVLFGDSHAEHLFIGISERLKSESVVYFIRAGLPFAGESNFDYLLDYINAHAEIETVIYASYWARAVAAFGEEVFQSKLNNTIGAFSAAHKRVVLVGDVPDFGFDPANCNYENQFRFSNCQIDIVEYQSQKESYWPTLSKYSDMPDVDLVSIDDLFCNERTCSMIRDNMILYRDNDHLNIPASRLVGAEIVRRSLMLSAIGESTNAFQ